MKKMKARKLLLAGMTAGLAITLASCGGGGSRQANYSVPEGGFDDSKQITIRFYHTMGDGLQQVLNTAVEAFQKEHPNVKIEHSQVGGYDDVKNQITTQIPTHEEPHIAYCYSDHVALYNKAHAVVQLDNLIDDPNYGFTAAQKADFIEGYYKEGKQFGDDMMYTLPFSKSTEVLYYNKTEFDKNNWQVPTTWEEMMALCDTIKNHPSSGKSIIPLGIDSESNLFIELTEQIGSGYTSATGNHYLFDNAKNREFVTKFKEWFEKGYFTTQNILGTYTSSLFTASQTTAEGAPQPYSLMSVGSTGGASHQYPSNKSFEVGVAPIPVWKNGKLKVISQGPSLCLFQKDDPQEVLASWLFMKTLFTTEFQAAFSKASGYNPVLKSTYENPEYADWLNKGDGKSSSGLIALTAKASRELIDYYFTSPAFNGSSKAREQVGDLFIAAINGTKTIDKAFKDAIEECED